MSEKSKCPYCGAEMTGELNEFFSNLFEYRYRCECCGSVAPFVIVENGLDKGLKASKAKALEFALNRAEPKNRVLTLEELEAYCEGGADATPLWVEFDGGINGWMLIAPVRETRKMYFVSKLLVTVRILYGKGWRCWLRKPTEAERRGTPWAGDSRE